MRGDILETLCVKQVRRFARQEIDAILTIDISLDKYVLMNPGIIYIDPEDVVKSLKVEHDSKIKEPKRKWSIYL